MLSEKKDYRVFIMLIMVMVLFMLSLFTFKAVEEDKDSLVFAEVGDSYTVTAEIEPWYADNKELTWTLEWDAEHTSSTLYNQIKKYPPTNNVGMEVSEDGLSCTLTCIKYHTVVWVKQTVYLKLTCTSVENPELSLSCLIKLG